MISRTFCVFSLVSMIVDTYSIYDGAENQAASKQVKGSAIVNITCYYVVLLK